MKKVTIRQCTHEDVDAIFQLDNAWEEEGVSYVFIPVSREDFMTDFERFEKYYFVAESEGRIVGYVNGSVRVNEKVPLKLTRTRTFDNGNVLLCYDPMTG